MKYKDAGVDIDAGNELVERIKGMPSTLGIGEFAGSWALGAGDNSELVATTDGIGTKFDMAWATGCNVHCMNAGVDLVCALVNDLVAADATPLFVLDYLSMPYFDIPRAEAVVRGIAEGCRFSGAKLLGGETAEMPTHWEPTLAGFAVGVREQRLRPRAEAGHAIIGFPSSGVHTNGLSLVRAVFGDELVNEQLLKEVLKPSKNYTWTSRLVEASGYPVYGKAHITGGGLVENIQRALPDGLRPSLSWDWPVPEIFGRIQSRGVLQAEMRRVFNMGIGFAMIVSPKHVQHFVNGGVIEIGEVVTS